MEIVLLWCFVLAWMAKRGAEDLVHAVKGTPNPRYEMKRERARAAGQSAPSQPRYGTRDWFGDLYSDALAAHTERRREAAKAKAQPLDDLAEMVREDRPKGRPVSWRYETPEPPVPPRPAPERKVDEPKPQEPQPAKGDRKIAQERTPRGVYDASQSFTCDGCGEERYPAGQKVIPGQGVHCQYCQTYGPEAVRAMQPDARPDARIIQFPTVKLIEKEITMANSEVTGLSTAIAFAEQAATAHTSFATTGAEGYVGALERGGNGGEVIGSAREAMEASGIAADRWAAHRAKLQEQLSLKEAHQSNPDAGDKEFLLAE